MYGMTGLSMKELVFVAKSWNRAPEMAIDGDGFESSGYDMGQRAYVINRKDETPDGRLSLQIAASENSPVYNPAFVIKNWSKAPLALTLNGKQMKRGKRFRVGVNHTVDGANVIVWIRTRSTEPIAMTLK